MQGMAHGHLPDMGPAGSVAGTYHGAFYYYLYFIPALLTGFHPWGTAAFTAVLSTFAVVFLIMVLRKLFDERVALFGGFIYSISLASVVFGRWQWNPNTVPFFMALALFAYSQAKNQHWYLVLAFFSMGAITQLHLSGYAMIPVALFSTLYFVKDNISRKIWVASAGAFLLPWIPTIIHELRNGFPLFRYFLAEDSGAKVGLLGSMKFLAHVSDIIFTVPFLVVVPLVFGMYQLGKKFANPVAGVSLGAVVFSFLLYSSYSGILYNQYAEVLFPLFPLLFAGAVKDMLRGVSGLVLVTVLTVLIAIMSFLAWYHVFIYHQPSFL